MMYTVGAGVNFTQANASCAFHGGDLAEIPNEQVYEAVYNYIKFNWQRAIDELPTSSYIPFGTGLSYSYNVSNEMISNFV